MVWPGEVERHITYFKALSWAIVPFTRGVSVESPVQTYRTRSQVEGILHACSGHTYTSCSFWAGIEDKRYCEFIDHWSGIDISTFTVIVC